MGDVQRRCGSFRRGHREEVCAAIHVGQGLLFLEVPTPLLKTNFVQGMGQKM